MKWTIVGFQHPFETKSLIYRQGISQESLHKAIDDGIAKGCNLFSIRGSTGRLRLQKALEKKERESKEDKI